MYLCSALHYRFLLQLQIKGKFRVQRSSQELSLNPSNNGTSVAYLVGEIHIPSAGQFVESIASTGTVSGTNLFSCLASGDWFSCLFEGKKYGEYRMIKCFIKPTCPLFVYLLIFNSWFCAYISYVIWSCYWFSERGLMVYCILKNRIC